MRKIICPVGQKVCYLDHVQQTGRGLGIDDKTSYLILLPTKKGTKAQPSTSPMKGKGQVGKGKSRKEVSVKKTSIKKKVVKKKK